MEKIKINCPDGYEVDKDKSTFEEIVFKPKVLTEYWEYIGDSGDFTKGKIYKCLDPKNINSYGNFIDGVGDENGHYRNNTKLFKPSTKEAFDEQNRPKLPTKWEEVSHYSGCLTDGIFYSTMPIRPSITNMVAWPTREYAEASIALCKLIRLRDIYNGDWKPNWQSYGEYKYVIYYFNDMIQIDSVATTKILLHFKTRELRDEFLKNFKELIEEAKLLL